MGIITISDFTQNYWRTEDKLQYFTMTITVAPFQRLISVDKDKVSVTQALSADGERHFVFRKLDVM